MRACLCLPPLSIHPVHPSSFGPTTRSPPPRPPPFSCAFPSCVLVSPFIALRPPRPSSLPLPLASSRVQPNPSAHYPRYSLSDAAFSLSLGVAALVCSSLRRRCRQRACADQPRSLILRITSRDYKALRSPVPGGRVGESSISSWVRGCASLVLGNSRENTRANYRSIFKRAIERV